MRKYSIAAAIWIAAAAFVLPGCSPAVQSQTNQPSDEKGVPVPASTWDTILASARLGSAAKTYMVKTTGTLIQGSLHSSYSVYGGVNPPDRANFGFVEGNDYTKFYQQGKAAYYYDNGRWNQTQALSDINPYASYAAIIEAAAKRGVKLVQLKQEYVNDEYCDVYRAILPGDIANVKPNWIPDAMEGTTGDIQYTFYVGQTDHYLRQVSTVSVGGLPHVGSMEADVDTVFFDMNQPVAEVTLPKDLVQQLENAGN
jgi:hypothetical protein